ncbi:MAG TPA: hypothetical protein EYN91_08650 [Candidatus Melainabacteria bacterium]|nr:hypothetical protein [Candidatus Melainabacteria bacterium]
MLERNNSISQKENLSQLSFADVFPREKNEGACAPAAPEELRSRQKISPNAIDQDYIPNCFFQAALASLADTEKGRRQIECMISRNADGSRTVRFPGADKDVVITKEELEESASSNRADWAKTIETAFLKYNSDGVRSFLSLEGVGPLGRIRTTREAIKLLTGDSVGVSQFTFSDVGSLRFSFGKISKENVEEQLKWGVENQSVMTAGTNWKGTRLIGEHDSSPAADMHVYSVLDYDEKSRELTLRNPWGHHDGVFERMGDTIDGITAMPNGCLKMSLDTFYEKFSDLNVSGRSDGQNAIENMKTDVANLPRMFFSAGNQFVRGNPIEAMQTNARALGTIPNNIANANTSFLCKAGGWALDHPLTTVIVPTAPFIASGITQAKELGSSVFEQIRALKF